MLAKSAVLARDIHAHMSGAGDAVKSACAVPPITAVRFNGAFLAA